MSEERLWKFQRPEWLNSAYVRSAGVYTAGGLVCPVSVSVAVSCPIRIAIMAWGEPRASFSPPTVRPELLT